MATTLSTMSTSIGTAFKSISDYKNLTSGWGSYIIIAGAVLFSLWYSILFGYMYPNTKNPDNFPAGIQKMGLLLGVGLGGCLLMAIAITLACLVWLSVEQACILNIGLSVLAIGTSVSALAISTISSR